MLTFRRAIIGSVLICSFLLAGLGSVYAARPAASMDHLTVKVTKTAKVWGTVTVDYKHKGKLKMVGSCSKAKCTFKVPHMAKLVLTEKPNTPTTWPFKDWKVTNGGKTTTSKAKKLKFTISGGKATVKAVYVLK